MEPLSYQKWTGTSLDLATLRANSARRLAANPFFTAVQKSVEQVRKQQEATLRPLQLAKFLEARRRLGFETEELNAGVDRTTGLEFKLLSPRENREGQAELEQDGWNNWKDFYLEESVNVWI